MSINSASSRSSSPELDAIFSSNVKEIPPTSASSELKEIFCDATNDLSERFDRSLSSLRFSEMKNKYLQSLESAINPLIKRRTASTELEQSERPSQKQKISPNENSLKKRSFTVSISPNS